jgi:hypothetical protein
MSVLIGAGFSKNVDNKKFLSWDELLKDIVLYLYGNDIEYISLKLKKKEEGLFLEGNKLPDYKTARKFKKKTVILSACLDGITTKKRTGITEIGRNYSDCCGFRRLFRRKFIIVKTRLILFVILLCLFSCKTGDKKNGISNEAAIPVIDLEHALRHLSKEKMNFSEFIEDITYVPLETNDQSILGSKWRPPINITQNYIFVGEKMFRKNGRFVRQLGKIGQGPEEYILARDIAVDEEVEEFYVNDNATHNIYSYGFDNQFKKKIPVHNYSFSLSSADKGNIMLFRDHWCGWFPDFFEYQIVNMGTGTVSYTRNNPAITSEYTNKRTSQNIVWHYNGEAYYYEILTDSVFRLKNGVIDTCKYIINLGKNKNSMDDNLYVKMSEIVESSQFLFFSISKARSLYYAAYNKQTGEIRINKLDEFFNNDIDGGFLWLFNEIPNDKMGFRYVLPHLAKERIEMLSRQNTGYDREKNQNLRRLIEQISEDDNDIYYFFHLK